MTPELHKRIAVIPGDGIGPEVIREAVKVVRTLKDLGIGEFEIGTFSYGGKEYRETGITLPGEAVQEIRRKYDAVLLGTLGDPKAPDQRYVREIFLGLREGLDLFVGFRPIDILHPKLNPLRDVSGEKINLSVFRDITEGFSANIGGEQRSHQKKSIAVQESIYSRTGVQRLMNVVFEFARRYEKRRITLVDKSNLLRYTHNLWFEIFKEIGGDYSGITGEHMNVDSFLYEMMRNPGQFQVVVTPDLFGGIISEFCAALQGGVGVAATSYLHPGKIGLFRPVHGPAPNAVDRNIANPFGAIDCIRQMLTFFGRPKTARLIRDSLHYCVEHRLVTPDLGGSLGTGEVGDYVCQAAERLYSQARGQNAQEGDQ